MRALLEGGDRRSIAQVERARRLVHADSSRVREVAALCADEDPLVRMRAFDLLEKLAHDDVSTVTPFKQVFLDAPDDAGWEIKLQIVRALPLFQWKGRALSRAIALLERSSRHPKKFVRAWAADGLARFALDAPELRAVLERVLTELESSGAKSLMARARAIRRALAAHDGPSVR